jgi:hypothetical protein
VFTVDEPSVNKYSTKIPCKFSYSCRTIHEHASGGLAANRRTNGIEVVSRPTAELS